MPALLEPALVGKRQDLQDMIYVADVKTTPGIASIKKGKKLTNMLYDFIVKSYGSRKSGGVPDGKDVNAFDAQSPKVSMQARGEVFRRAPMVGFIAEKMSKAGGVAGVTDLYTEAKADQLKELGRDMEKELWSTQDSQADDGVNGSKMRGLGLWISNAPSLTDTLTIPSAAQTPSNQIFTGSISSMTEDDLGGLIQAKYENTGASSDLRGFVTPVVKNRIGFFSRYQANVDGFAPVVQVNSGKLSGNTLFGATIDVYKTDWGTFRLFPVLTDFMPSSYYGFFLDMDHPRMRDAGVDEYDDLPNLGGGPRGLYQSIISVHPGDPRAHSKIAGSA